MDTFAIIYHFSLIHIAAGEGVFAVDSESPRFFCRGKIFFRFGGSSGFFHGKGEGGDGSGIFQGAVAGRCGNIINIFILIRRAISGGGVAGGFKPGAYAAVLLLHGKQMFYSPCRFVEYIGDAVAADFWKWQVLTWMNLELYPIPELAEFRREYRKVILRNADKMVADQQNSYPYRTLWHAGNGGWVHAMAWGNYHPLRRAMTLIAAHKISGEQKYLDGAYLANDFHNGANPLGRSMTSGLGKIYPAAFLDLTSYAGYPGEFVPGITPYGNTFGIDRNAVNLVYKHNAGKLPIFRRYVNLEFLSVPSSEYSVWETIAPAAVTTGYLIEKPALPSTELKKRRPAADFRKLPGYKALP